MVKGVTHGSDRKERHRAAERSLDIYWTTWMAVGRSNCKKPQIVMSTPYTQKHFFLCNELKQRQSCVQSCLGQDGNAPIFAKTPRQLSRSKNRNNVSEERFGFSAKQAKCWQQAVISTKVKTAKKAWGWQQSRMETGVVGTASDGKNTNEAGRVKWSRVSSGSAVSHGTRVILQSIHLLQAISSVGDGRSGISCQEGKWLKCR